MGDTIGNILSVGKRGRCVDAPFGTFLGDESLDPFPLRESVPVDVAFHILFGEAPDQQVRGLGVRSSHFPHARQVYHHRHGGGVWRMTSS